MSAKGTLRVFIGAVFVILQIMGLMGQVRYNGLPQYFSMDSFTSLEIFLGDLCFFIGGNIFAIIGVAFIVSGIMVSRKTTGDNSSPPPDASDEEQPPTRTKQRFCKHCGGLIDSDTKQCTNCGKQYFRRPSENFIIAAIIVSVMVGANIYLIHLNLSQREQYNAQIEALENEVDEWKVRYLHASEER